MEKVRERRVRVAGVGTQTVRYRVAPWLDEEARASVANVAWSAALVGLVLIGSIVEASAWPA